MRATLRGCFEAVCGVAALGFALAAPVAASAQEKCMGDGPHLKVIVEGLRSADGYVSVELYPDDPKLFLGHNQQLAVAHDRLTGMEQTVCLSVPGPGYYALSVYHDENGDDQFNRNKLGIPTEGVGLSNNPRILFGLPAFEKVRFKIAQAETTMRVALKYFAGKAK